MNTFRLAAAVAVAVASLSFAACRKSPSPPRASVSITSPATGDTLRGSVVEVTLTVSGIELAPVAENRPGTAHHHLFLDVDATSDGPIPVAVPGIVHLGGAQTAHRWEGVAPGRHRIIAVLADPGHVPLRPSAADTVTIVVVAP